MTDSKDIERQIDFDDALARVFSKVEKATKDATNPHFRSKYTTLASVTDACSDALISEGFSWPQLITTRQEGDQQSVLVTTQIRRKGSSIEATLALPVGGKGNAQDVGSAITYARRYGLSAIVGVCPADDDDGNAASEDRPPRRDEDYDRPPVQNRPQQTPRSDGDWRPTGPDDDPAEKFKRALKATKFSWGAVCTLAGISPIGRPTDDELSKLWAALKHLKETP